MITLRLRVLMMQEEGRKLVLLGDEINPHSATLTMWVRMLSSSRPARSTAGHGLRSGAR